MRIRPSTWRLLAALLVAVGVWIEEAWRRAPESPAESPPAVEAATRTGLMVASWNVENLYDTQDDRRNRGDDEFLPSNPATRWTQARFKAKIAILAQVIGGLNRGQGPDLLGLQEIENEYVLQQLVAQLPRQSYGIVHADSPDPRGIDVALLYRRDRFELLETRTHAVPLSWRRTTRDILQAGLRETSGEILQVFVNHWPARGAGVHESDPDRFAAAQALARALRETFRRDPGARVMVLGDFNDEPFNRSLQVGLGAADDPSSSNDDPQRVYNLAATTTGRESGSYFHGGSGNPEWRLFDQILVSGTLLDDTGIRYENGSFRIERPKAIVDRRGWRQGAPAPTFGGDRYRGGASDHFPVSARFVLPGP
jgi:endonuclease/exonuclease/phosphatase family metal-dependent hydrolase